MYLITHGCFVRYMHACEILSRILIDNLDCLKQTLYSNVDAYHGKKAFMLSSVLELLPNLKSTYFASMNPPAVGTRAEASVEFSQTFTSVCITR